VAVVQVFWRLGWCFGWLLVAGLVRAMVVVVAFVFGEAPTDRKGCRWLRPQASCRRMCPPSLETGLEAVWPRRITRALHGSAFDAFSTSVLSRHAVVPSRFPVPGKAGGPEVTSFRTSAPCGGDLAPS
jgi:hypothetical protein